MGSQQRVQAIIRKRALQRHEADFLQHDVAIRIGEDFFLDPVASLQFGVGQFVNWNAGFERHILEFAVALLFGEKAGAVGDDQTLVAGASLVHAWEIDLVQDAMAQGEPYPAVLVERGTHSAFGARSPARSNSRPARRKACYFVIAHSVVLDVIPG